jgi:diguanylate cyclase (GGDEF)-like protein
MPSSAITIADIDRVLAGGFRWLRFPAPIEARFETDIGARRSRFLLVTGAVTLVLFQFFLVRDRLLLPDMFNEAIIFRVGIITPLTLATFAVLWRNPRPWIRESMEAVMTVLIAAGVLYLIHSSHSPLAEHAHYSMLLILVFPNIIQRVRFWYATVASIIVVVMYATVVPEIRSMPDEAIFGAVLTLAMTTLLSLVTNWKLEIEERRAYLMTLREELRSQQLMNVNEELSAISMLDPLTGLANRRRLEQFIDALWNSSLKPVTFMMIDIDHFKRFNDRYGHQAGDACLKMVVETLQEELRHGTDLAARFGGEEFLVVLPDSDLADGIRAAERIRGAVERRAIAHITSPTASVVTVSIGVAVVRPDAKITVAEAIAAADRALYSSKQHGRNSIWPRPSPSATVHELPAQSRA